MTNVGFLIVDIDFEEVVATVYDADDTPLSQIVVATPASGGDGGVDIFDFGAVGGVRRLEVSVSNIVNPPLHFGIGLDNLTFAPEPSAELLALPALVALGALARRARTPSPTLIGAGAIALSGRSSVHPLYLLGVTNRERCCS